VVNHYRDSLLSHDYLTDGLVIAVNHLGAQEARGATAHHPKGKLAFKLPSETAITLVEDIEVDVGRTGRMTFVGIVSPVTLSSARVRRVTLNNARYIEDNEINVGCRIEITRSGEVIPKHERTIETNGVYVFPARCPLCDTDVVRSETGVDLLCPNSFCRARMRGRIANWIAVTGIENLGDSTLDKLWECGAVRSIADLYRLTIADIAPLEGMGDRSAARIIDSIDAARNLTVESFLAGLGIDGLGPGVAKLVAARYRAKQDLPGITEESLRTINGIGDVLAVNICEGLAKFGLSTLAELEALNVSIADAVSRAEGILAGRVLVITGTLSRPRKDIERIVAANGGKVASAISGSTSWLVCNDASASAKYRKAQAMGIPVITEDTLYDMIAGNSVLA
jgi:DNA ligase (NAD+)